ncbi:hypothetical protein HF086_017773 [Spodoptera exigua]|uniref:Uncharacterized protein n=1 Tax=Spodoptera exigua TaxID=7107 RepID=A0A922MAW3_SPOEX|nr:hypothetical protein HF086_017773 [Spodoptera exigua]
MYLLLALVATCTSLQNTAADDNFTSKVEEATPPQNMVSDSLIKSVPLIRYQRSPDFNQIQPTVAPGFRGNWLRRDVLSGQFGHFPQNGFVNPPYPNGFIHAGPNRYNTGAPFPDRLFNPGHGHMGNLGGFRTNGFVPRFPQDGFRNPGRPGGFIPRAIRPGGFVNPIVRRGFVGSPLNPIGIPHPRNEGGYGPGFNNQHPNRNQLNTMHNRGPAGAEMQNLPDGSVGIHISAFNETDAGTVNTVVHVVVVPNKEQNNLHSGRNDQNSLEGRKNIVADVKKILDNILDKH